jgi:hypothetical protein
MDKATRKQLWAEYFSLRTAHGNLQRTGSCLRTGSPGCNLSREQISARCAELRARMDEIKIASLEAYASIMGYDLPPPRDMRWDVM